MLPYLCCYCVIPPRSAPSLTRTSSQATPTTNRVQPYQPDMDRQRAAFSLDPRLSAHSSLILPYRCIFMTWTLNLCFDHSTKQTSPSSHMIQPAPIEANTSQPIQPCLTSALCGASSAPPSGYDPSGILPVTAWHASTPLRSSSVCPYRGYCVAIVSQPGPSLLSLTQGGRAPQKTKNTPRGRLHRVKCSSAHAHMTNQLSMG